MYDINCLAVLVVLLTYEQYNVIFKTSLLQSKGIPLSIVKKKK